MVWRPLFLISSFSSLLERLGRERKDLDAHLALVRWKSRRPEALAPFYVRLSKRKKKKTKRELWELGSADSVARRTRLLAVTNYFNSRSSQDPKVSQSAPIGILLQIKTPWNRLIRTVKCCYKLLFGHRRLFCLSASVSAAARRRGCQCVFCLSSECVCVHSNKCCWIWIKSLIHRSDSRRKRNGLSSLCRRL